MLAKFETPVTSARDQWVTYLYGTIVPQINFNGATGSNLSGLRSLLQESPALVNASAALGAMFYSKAPGHLIKTQAEQRTAFGHYSLALHSIKDTVAHLGNKELLPTLWAILWLSVFELMADATGDNWIRHILTGVSQILKVCGPGLMQTDGYRQFYLEIRIFEISRSLITTTETILATHQWQQLSKDIWEGERLAKWHPNELLLDLMVEISDLGWRATTEISNMANSLDSPEQTFQRLAILSADGTRFRKDLEHQRQLNLQPGQKSSEYQQYFQKIQHAAISIYLSGIFDYHEAVWTQRGIPVPTLEAAQVDQHVSTILINIEHVLAVSELSAISFVFALRVAGARSYTRSRRDTVMDLLRRLGCCYAVAGAFVPDLISRWNT